MRLLYLVKEHDAIGLTPHGLGKLTALVIADISRRCADKTRYGELLHILGHIDAHDVVLIVKEALCQRLCKLGLTDTGGAEEHKGAVLTDDALMQQLAQMQYLFPLALAELCHRDARPLGDDICYLLLGDGVMHHGVALALLGLLLRLGKLTLKRREVGVFELCGLFILIVELGVLDIGVKLLKLCLEVLYLVHAALLAVPARFHLVEPVLEICKLLTQLCKSVLTELIVLLLERHLLYLKLHYLAADIIHLRRHGVYLGTDKGAGLIDEVYGLVGEETVGYIAVRERCGGDKGAVVNTNAVEHLVALLETTENGYRVLHRRLVHLHGLETTLKRRVLLDILAVLVKRGRAYAVKLAACKHRLEEVAGIHAALGLARADDGMKLVYKENNASLGFAYLLKHCLQALLKLTAVLCARDKRTHIKGEYGLILESVRHVAADYTLGKPLCDSGLADARLTDKHRVILGLTGEYAHNVSYFGVAADDRVKLIVTRTLHKIRAVFIQRVIGALGVVAGDGRGLDLAELGSEGGLIDAVVCKDALGRGGARGEDADHQMLDGQILVSHRLCRLQARKAPRRSQRPCA